MASKSGFLLAFGSAFVVMTAAGCPPEFLEQFCEAFPEIAECQGTGETGATETEQPDLAASEEASSDLVEAEPDEIGS